MRISVLLENTAFSDEFEAEHGLSLCIETGGHKILFDMGQTDAYARNAERLGIDLSLVDAAVLSHGHYDHGGGLARFLSANPTAPVYLSPYAFEPHYSSRYIGLDVSLEHNERLIRAEKQTEILPGMRLFPALPCRFPIHPFGLTAESGGIRKDDDFRHEQYLLMEENGRRILFSGCSHRGILNIAGYFGGKFGVDVIVGGFHFSKLDPDGDGKNALDEAVEFLKRTGITFYTCHCTGEAQAAYLQKSMADHLRIIRCGEIFEI